MVQFFVGRAAGFARLAERLPWPRAASVVFLRKLLGTVALAAVPLLLLLGGVLTGTPQDYGLHAVPTSRDGLWFAVVGLPVLLGVGLSARFGAEDPVRPEIRLDRWTPGLLLANAGAWLVYLFAYEAVLRGFVFLPWADAFGVWPAIAVNVAIYMAIHLPMGARETAVSVPFGALACVAVVDTGSVWVPFVLHAIAAVTNDSVRALRGAR